MNDSKTSDEHLANRESSTGQVYPLVGRQEDAEQGEAGRVGTALKRINSLLDDLDAFTYGSIGLRKQDIRWYVGELRSAINKVAK